MLDISNLISRFLDFSRFSQILDLFHHNQKKSKKIQRAKASYGWLRNQPTNRANPPVVRKISRPISQTLRLVAKSANRPSKPPGWSQNQPTNRPNPPLGRKTSRTSWLVAKSIDQPAEPRGWSRNQPTNQPNPLVGCKISQPTERTLLLVANYVQLDPATAYHAQLGYKPNILFQCVVVSGRECFI